VLVRARDNILAGQARVAPTSSDDIYAQGVWKMLRVRDAVKEWFRLARR